MILHAMIVDDEEDVLESLAPGFVRDLARRLPADEAFRKANEEAGRPIPAKGRINVKVSASGYRSAKVAKYSHHNPVHVHLHLCCEKGGSFRHALRLLKEQFFAVVVSDLRFSDDLAGARAGKLFIEDVCRRNPDTFGILYSAYQRPEGFPEDRFLRKGAADNLVGEELLAKMIEGFTAYVSSPDVRRFARELDRRGIVYQSDAFGATLRRLYDFASLYFGEEPPNQADRRRPRPTLLIDGETGAGKTELAGLLHVASDRRDEPFVSATCNQLTNESFLRSILFGHIKGSFSGAANDRPGLVQTAGGGVLLLDDLHKLSDGCSVILHSFLDDGEYSHLGEDEVRRRGKAAVLCTVESPRWEQIKAEQLLSESFVHRVEQLVLRVPPLRDRPEDIEYQANHYCALMSQEIGEEMELSPGAIAWLVDYGFPGGNSRKLRDFVRGVQTAHARVTDYLDVAELEEYATETGLSAPTTSRVRVSAVPEGGATPDWPGETGSWRARIVALASLALVDEYDLAPEAANAACRELFEDHFPRLWDALAGIGRSLDPERPIEIKLFDELLRYYAIYRAGAPAKGARELGMKDNALREFVYSREQRRGVERDA